MRILDTSDWHLGRTFHGRVLDDAHAASPTTSSSSSPPSQSMS
ncbi:hypothetical protein [Actinomyces oris]|uniref:Exonuclease SbcCD subunit D n=1 Tax=Actinomyces oris TaxID=544580 RepID=A0AAW9L412_9ACTO|nr:hypothetical protein [Actinomyces oris]MEA1305956.1 hypothetical protein [Actinomyces oris]